VCPVKIPIPQLLRRLRNESYSRDAFSTVNDSGFKKNLAETIGWKGWELMNTHPRIHAAVQKIIGALGSKIPKWGPLKQWTRFRTAPQFAKKSLHQLVQEQGIENE
jgi:L-lactate dehydrogenase complex protein LldF